MSTKGGERWIGMTYGAGLLCLFLLMSSQGLAGGQVHNESASVAGGYEAQAGDITIALTGDSLITRPLMPFREKKYLEVRDLLLGADVRFTNGETLFHNYENWPNPNAVGNMLRCDPSVIKDLEWIGINMISTANNHSNDFGENGVLTNIRNLNDAGLVHAGTGADYAEAVAPAYLETPKGRVALVAATSSGQIGSRAGEQLRDYKGTPGVNFIRWISEWTVDKEAFNQLQRIAKEFKWDQGGDSLLSRFYEETPQDKSAEVTSFHDRNSQGMPTSTKTNRFIEDPPARFVLGDSFERHTRIFKSDLERNVQSVSDAHRMADWVIYSLHNHEGGENDNLPAEHVVALAHSVIDAGADVFVGTGPHHFRGIEIYKGRPIFYCLGVFIMQIHSTLLISDEARIFSGLGEQSSPADFYATDEAGGVSSERDAYEGVIPVITFKGKKLHRIDLYPIEMGFGLPRYETGRPRLAEGQEAREILARMQRVSQPFHTKIDIRGNIGVIDIE